MLRRPVDKYVYRLRKEDIPEEMQGEKIKRYNEGGIREYEPEVKPKLDGIPLEQISFTDPLTKDVLKWVYVGDLWWCRKRKKPRIQYEFARVVAYVNDLKKPLAEIHGLWNNRIHLTKQKPIIVYRNGMQGYIVGYNDFEVFVQWCDPITGERGIPSPVRSIVDVAFEFVEDFNKYSRVFANIKRNG